MASHRLDLNFEQGIGRRRVQDVVLDLGKEESSNLRTVVDDEFFFDFALVAEDSDDSVLVDFHEVEAGGVDFAIL